MSDTSTITINHVCGDDALYCHYESQISPQPCYVELDCDNRTLSASYDAEIGPAVPVRVWHHRIIRFQIPCLTDEAVNDLLDEIAEDASAICEGYERVWDGNNHVGRFTEDADGLIQALNERCQGPWDERSTINVWHAGDWYEPVTDIDLCEELGLTANTTDDELNEMAAAEEENAEDEGFRLNGTEEYLRDIRDRLREGKVVLEEMPDHLRGSHIAANNWGTYPHNGATRRWVEEEEAEAIVEADPDGYAHIVTSTHHHGGEK